ncbi:hypothetical protein [Paraburkholderia sp. SOS3]|uniref:hypothetical protein n=1 Tax=Paraburkholderia sp. SOS3 TaxID=1926494 RepID=UPI0009477CEA|nr:hypothetical protein [Paraburkholderia sp. SOS3]APR40504.1 hypothetical protein BTO02_33730 [Paraburkholderia sp. SOS3]
MSADLNRPAAAALRLAVDRFVGQEATPQVCVRIKKAFIQIMREQFGVDWPARVADSGLVRRRQETEPPYPAAPADAHLIFSHFRT